MKSKYYCQLCKFGVDSEENFRAHLVTPTHRLQKEAYDRNPGAYTEYFSGKFARQFLEVLQKSFGSKATNVSKVYLTYLTDSTRVRLTSTKWVTLNEFLDWLDKNFQGRCAIRRIQGSTEIYIQFLKENCQGLEDHLLRRHEAASQSSAGCQRDLTMTHKKRKSCDVSDDHSEGVKRQKTQATSDDPFNISALVKEAFADMKKNTLKDKPQWNLSRNRVSLSFARASGITSVKSALQNGLEENHDESNDNEKLCDSSSCRHACEEQTRQEMSPARSWRPSSSKLSLKSSALEDLMKEQEMERVRANRRRNWLCPGIVVKVVTNRLGKKYYGRLAVVIDVKHLFTALLRFTGNGALLYADQSHVQTVLPATGERVLIVNGGYRGYSGILKNTERNENSQTVSGLCSVLIDNGVLNGRLVGNISCADVAMWHRG